MKKYLILFLALVLISSCATVKPAQRIVDETFLDYRPFTKDGFLLSPNPYPSEYEAVGEILIKVVPAMKGQYTSSMSDYDTAMQPQGKYVVAMENITYQELAGIAVAHAKRLGADALVNFRISKLDRHPYRKWKNWATSEYVISGFCIERK
jgi:hypothetical protein